MVQHLLMNRDLFFARRRLVITALLLLFHVVATSQNKDYREFTINNGLPHTDATCTVQDNKGFLWFATTDGLCRYDGTDMVIYRNDHADPHSISNNRITGIELDVSRNGLWIATQGGGLNFMNLVSGKFTRMLLSDEGQHEKVILSVKLVEDQTLWVGTENGLFVAKITGQKIDRLQFTKVLLANEKIIQSIYQDKNNGLWIGTLGALYYKAASWKSFQSKYRNTINNVHSVVGFDNTHILVGSLQGLFKIDLLDFHLERLNSFKVTSLLVDKPGSIWVGTYSDGIIRCSMSGSVLKNYSFVANEKHNKDIVKNIFKDRSSSIFISTLGSGIKVINEHGSTFKSYPANFNEGELFHLKRPLCFAADQHSNLYIGVRKKGLAIFDRQRNTAKLYQVGAKDQAGNIDNSVTALFVDNKSGLWIGSEKGLYFLNSKDLVIRSVERAINLEIPAAYPYRINKIIQDRRGRVWVVTSKGLFCYKETGQLIYSSMEVSSKYSSLNTSFLNDIVLVEGESGHTLTIWLATKSGISRLELNNENFSTISLKRIQAGTGNNQLYSNWVSLLHKDQNDQIWAGTIGGGLSRVVEDENNDVSFETITTRTGLLTNDIETLLEDVEGNFWIGSIGLTKYNPKNKSFSYYNASDGLQSNAFKVWAAHRSNNGEMIFGGINGFNIFYPENIKKKTIAFKPQFTNLFINNLIIHPGSEVEGEVILKNTLPYTSEITLNHKIKNFGLEFASIHSHDFKQIVYRHMLVGYDKDWIYTNSGKRFVNYTALPPGNYTFKVTASSGEGAWNAEALILKINVVPSFWASKYGYLLYASILILALFLQRRYTLIRIKVKHTLQLEKSRQEQEIKLYEDKVHFFTNISHELRTPLTLITSPIEQLVKNPTFSEHLHNKFVVIQKSTERLRHMIDQILDLRKLELGKLELQKEAVNISLFFGNIFIQFQELIASKNIRFLHEVPVNTTCLLDVFKMEQVLVNLMSNALKFTPERGEINFTSYLERDSLIINISNSGSALSPLDCEKVFEPFYQVSGSNRGGTGLGLSICRSLVNLHAGTIGVRSDRDCKTGISFTCFTIQLPAALKEVFIEEEEAGIQIQVSLAHEGASGRTQKPVIMIVDDNEDLREILEEELNVEYEVFAASNGREALKMLNKKKPALIITDVMMPDLDGFALCKAVKSNVATNDIPVIMLTARNTEQSRLEGFEGMADDYISKPFSLKELHLKIKNTIRHRDLLRIKLTNDVALNPAPVSFVTRDEQIMNQVIAIIETNIDDSEFSVELLCKQAALSRPVLYRKIKELTGMSIQMFILDIRLKRAAQLLATKGFSVSEVMYKCGFSSASYFNKAFKNKYDKNPVHYNQSLGN